MKTRFNTLLLFTLLIFTSATALANPYDMLFTAEHNLKHKLARSEKKSNNEEEPSTENKKSGFLKNKSIDFFPIPVFQTRPDEGERYGLMPVVLFSDKETKAISVILAVIGQYNPTIKFSGATADYYYPHPVTNPDEVLDFYFEYAQRYYREATLHYLNPRLSSKYFFEGKLSWLKTPFTRFYGYGAQSTNAGESNYVSDGLYADLKFGYYLTHFFRVNFSEKITHTDLLSRAFPNVADTITTYGALPGVVDATNLQHGFSLTYDSRPKGINSNSGVFLQGGYFFSVQELGSDTTFQGFNFEGIYLKPFFNERTVSALRFFVQDMYGTNIPFYMQSNLGGATELRAYIPNRFTDTGKIIFTWEQRIKVFSLNLLGIPVDFHADPFVEIGRVFHHINHLGWDDVQPIAGIGLRAFVPPNVVGRLDIAIGKDDYGIYTMLGFPF